METDQDPIKVFNSMHAGRTECHILVLVVILGQNNETSNVFLNPKNIKWAVLLLAEAVSHHCHQGYFERIIVSALNVMRKKM